MAGPFGDLQPLPGPFGTQVLTFRLRVPWQDAPQVEQAVQQAASQAGVRAEARSSPRGKDAEVEIRAEGDESRLSEFVRVLLALASLLSAAAGAAMHGALAYLGFQAAPGLANITNALGELARGVAEQVKQGSMVPWIIGGGLVLLLLTRK